MERTSWSDTSPVCASGIKAGDDLTLLTMTPVHEQSARRHYARSSAGSSAGDNCTRRNAMVEYWKLWSGCRRRLQRCHKEQPWKFLQCVALCSTSCIQQNQSLTTLLVRLRPATGMQPHAARANRAKVANLIERLFHKQLIHGRISSRSTSSE